MTKVKTVAIGGDHAGFDHKSQIVQHLEAAGYIVNDVGTYSADSVDYPDFAHPVASAVETGAADVGVLICGTANGVAMTANKHQGIRAAICWKEELAAIAREHNDANIVCIPARHIEVQLAKAIVDRFLNTDFEGGRHTNRVQKISC